MSVDESKLADWQGMQARHGGLKAEEPELDLKGGGGGGTLDDMIPLKEYVDARDDAVESRLSQKLDKLSTKGTIWTAVATAVGVTLAVLAFGGDRFDTGLAISPAFQEAAFTQATVDNRQDANITELNKKLDILIVRTAPDHAAQTAERLRDGNRKPN